MDALRYFKKITSDSVTINRVKGLFKKYVKPGLQSKEKNAWAAAMKEKLNNS
ncbi:MAG: hypothetical protein GY754_03345 [bacterium]|nr:hypothetical protein [bacterium]